MGWLSILWESRIYVFHPELISLIITFRSHNTFDSLSTFSFEHLCVPLNFISLQTLVVTKSMCKFYQYCCLVNMFWKHITLWTPWTEHNFINILNRTKFLDNHKVGTSTIILDVTHITVLMSIFSACVTSVNLFLGPLNLKQQNFRTFLLHLLLTEDAKILKGTPMYYKNHELSSATMMPYVMGGQVNKLWEPTLGEKLIKSHIFCCEAKHMMATLPKRKQPSSHIV